MIETLRAPIQRADAKMGTWRASARERFHHPIEHAPTVAAALCARQQVDVQVGRIRLVRLGTKIVGVVIAVIYLLHTSPADRVAVGRLEARAQTRAPLALVPGVEGAESSAPSA